MPFLKFNVRAEYDELIECRKELDKLNDKAKDFDIDTPSSKIAAWQKKIARLTKTYDEMVEKAAKNGAEHEAGLSKSYDKAIEKVEKAKKALDEEKSVLDLLTKKLEESERKYNEAVANNDEAAMKKYKAEVERNTNAVNQQQVIKDKRDTSYQDAVDDMNAAEKKLGDFRAKLKEVNDGLVVLRGGLDFSEMEKQRMTLLVNTQELDNAKKEMDELKARAENFDEDTPIRDIKNWQDDMKKAEARFKQLQMTATSASAAYGTSLSKAEAFAKKEAEEAGKFLDAQTKHLNKIKDEIKAIEAEIATAQSNGDTALASKLDDKRKSLLSEEKSQTKIVNEAQADSAAADNDVEEVLHRQKEYQGEIDKSKEKVKELGDEIKDTKQKGIEANLAVTNKTQKTQEALSMMPEPIQKAASAAQNFGKMMRIAFSGGWMMLIGVIAAAIASLYRWFSKTSDGEEKLATITGYLKGVWEGFLNIVDRLFGKVYNTLTKVFDKVTHLRTTLEEIGNFDWSEGIKNFFKGLWNELEKLGTLFSKVFDVKTLFSDVEKYGAEVKAAFEQTKTGVMVTNVAKELHEEGKKGADLSVRRVRLKQQEAQYSTSIANIESRIAAAQVRMNQATATTNDKLKEQEKILDLIRKRENLKVGLASTKLQIVQDENKDNPNPASDIAKEIADAKNAYINAKSARDTAIAQAEESVRNMREQITSEMQELDNYNVRASEEYIRKQEDLIMANTQREIDMMADSAEKKRKQRELDYNKDMIQIRREYEDAQKNLYKEAEEYWGTLDEAKGRSFFNGIITDAHLNKGDAEDKTREFFSEREAQVEAERIRKLSELERKYMDVSDITDQYKSMYQKRRELDEEYKDSRLRLTEQIAILEAKVAQDAATEDEKIRLKTYQESLKEMDTAHIKAVLELDMEGVKKQLEKVQKNPAYFAAMQNAAILTTQTINDLTKALEMNMEALTDLPPDQLKVITDLMERLMDVKVKRDPYKAMKESAKGLADAQETLVKNQERYYNAVATQKRLTDELAEAQLNLVRARSEGGDKEVADAQKRVDELHNQILIANDEVIRSENSLNNAMSDVYSQANLLDKANTAVLGKVKEMASEFRNIGSAIEGMGLGLAGEIFGKVTDIVATIIDGIAKAREMAMEMEDRQLVELDLQAANMQVAASEKASRAADKNLSAANEEDRAASVGERAAETNLSASNAMMSAADKNLEAANLMNAGNAGVKVDKPAKVDVEIPEVEVDTDAITEAVSDGNDGDGLVKAMSGVASMSQGAANTQQSAGNTMMTAADEMLAAASKQSSNISVPSGASLPSGGEGFLGKAASAMNMASSIMQGVQFGMTVGSKMVSLFQSTNVSGDAQYEKYAKKIAEVNKLTDSVNRYRSAVLRSTLAEREWFATSQLFSIKDSWKEGAKARDDYYKKLNEQQAKYRDQSRMDGDWLGNVIIGSVGGAITGAVYGSSSGPWGTLIGGIVGGIAGGVAGATTSYAQQLLGNSKYGKDVVRAQDNLRIETQSKHTSFLGIGGRDQKTQDLRSWAKEKFGADLFDKDGMINKDLAEEILSTYGDKLQGETEATVKELVKLREQYDEYQKNLKDYVSSLYSPLVDNFVDAMWQWFDSGRDALYAFRDVAADTFRNIMGDMMKTIVLERVVGKFQDQIKDLYDGYLGGTMDETMLLRGVTELTGEMMGRFETQMPVLQEMMVEMQGAFESLGFNMGMGQGTNSGTSKVAANVTQDSIDEANGRMTAIHLTLLSIANDIIHYGDKLTEARTEEEMPRRGDEREVDYTEDISSSIVYYGESVVSLTRSNMEQRLALHMVHMNALAGIGQQIAESYIELQGIHEDTTSISRTMNRVVTTLDDWEQYVKRL